MACSNAGSSIFECTQSVCRDAEEFNEAIEEGLDAVDLLCGILAASGESVKCVVNGPVGTTCTTPEGPDLLTLAEALARLNACQIAAVAGEEFTAAAGQTVFNLAAAPANAWALEVALNGAICRDPADYALVGSTITFALPLTADDAVYTRSFTA